jgi:hypothetical protein
MSKTTAMTIPTIIPAFELLEADATMSLMLKPFLKVLISQFLPSNPSWQMHPTFLYKKRRLKKNKGAKS